MKIGDIFKIDVYYLKVIKAKGECCCSDCFFHGNGLNCYYMGKTYCSDLPEDSCVELSNSIDYKNFLISNNKYLVKKYELSFWLKKDNDWSHNGIVLESYCSLNENEIKELLKSYYEALGDIVEIKRLKIK